MYLFVVATHNHFSLYDAILDKLTRPTETPHGEIIAHYSVGNTMTNNSVLVHGNPDFIH